MNYFEDKNYYNCRNPFLDIVKYFTIFCVIWGHVVQQTCMLDNPQDDYIFRTIYTFHMPLFMGLSGFFWGKSLHRNGIKYYVQYKLTSRLKSLLIPMLSFGLLQILVTQKFGLMNYYNAVHGIWFLGDLIINIIVVLFIVKCFCNGVFIHDWIYFIIGIPFTAVPILGYGSNGVFMYFFFVAGYWIFVYYQNDTDRCLHYWKGFLFLYTITYFLFDIMPYKRVFFATNIFKHSLNEIILIDILRLLGGVSGCYLVLFIVYRCLPLLQDSVIERMALERGKITLDIYLINIIMLERISGPFYRKMVEQYNYNFFHDYGLLFEILSTFLVSCIMMEVIVLISKIINKSQYMAKFFFFR